MNDKKLNIVFVCSENITRSLIAEYCLKDYLQKSHINNIVVMSAGTDITTDVSKNCFAHFDELKKLGIDVSHHQRTQLTKKMAKEADLLVAMAENHQKWIKENFGISAPLFSEVNDGKKISINIPDSADPECDAVLRKTVNDINADMPRFVRNLGKFVEL